MAHRSQATSWTVSDLMLKSQLITEGKPARYRLITTRSNLDERGNIRVWTFGQRNINTQNKIILLVGETGTGKTTLINAIVNYILGVKTDDDVWFEITEDEDDQTESEQTQTTAVTVYEVFAQENPISVTIIDTPGYGDTRGVEHDRQIDEHLWKLFKHDTGVKEIDAVCLVIKGTENRLSDRQQYIFDAVLSLFGKDIEENIVIFVTCSTGLGLANIINGIKKTQIPCRKENGTDPVYFLFDNYQAEQRSTEYEEDYQKAWKRTEISLGNFFASLDIQNRKSLQLTESVLKKQIQLKTCVSNLYECIELKENKQKELIQIQEALKENQDKIQRNENITFTVTKYHKEKVTIEDASWWDRKATCCSVCEENCHEKDCWCAINPALCEVIKDGRCTVCTGKCHHSTHVRENKKYVTKSEEVIVKYTDLIKIYGRTDESTADISVDQQKFDNVKNKLETYKKQADEKLTMETRLKEELSKIEKEKTELVEEACKTIFKLTESALKPDSAFIMESLDFWIPRAEEAGCLDWVQKLKELRKIEPETEARLVGALKYVGTGFPKAFSSSGGKK